MIGFDIAHPDQKGKYANRMGKSGIRKLEDYLDGVPEQSEELLNDQARANLENRDDVPQTYKMTNARFPTSDGTLSEPVNSIVYRMTGATGKPVLGELDKPDKSKLASKNLKAKASCGGFINSTTFTITKGSKTWPLQRKKINIYDENPWLPSTLIFSGFTNDAGSVSYWQPYCDMGTFWDYTKPDIYFEISSADSAAVEVLNMYAGLAFQYVVRTPTYWDASQPGTVSIDGSGSSQAHALWVTQLVTKALEFNEGGELNGSSRFPVRIAWPSRNILTSFGGTSHALVSKIELRGENWVSENIVWHEFGHEMMYRTANEGAYNGAYNLGYDAMPIPNFHFGPHNGYEQQIYDLAFNEGWASYFENMLRIEEYSDPYYFSTNCVWYCVGSTPDGISHVFWNVGGENESRVATFLTRYTRNVLQVWPNALSLRKAFGKVRSSMWGMGSYMRDIHDVWNLYIRNNQPPTRKDTGWWSDSFIKTHNIASETYMDVSRLPGNP